MNKRRHKRNKNSIEGDIKGLNSQNHIKQIQLMTQNLDNNIEKSTLCLYKIRKMFKLWLRTQELT